VGEKGGGERWLRKVGVGRRQRRNEPEEIVHTHAKQIEDQTKMIAEIKGLQHGDTPTAQSFKPSDFYPKYNVCVCVARALSLSRSFVRSLSLCVECLHTDGQPF